jgi:Phosphate-selective porin O and P
VNLKATTIVALIAGSLAGSTAHASEEKGELLRLSHAYSDSVYAGMISNAPFPDALKVSLQTQFRYNVNLRGSNSTTLANPDDDVTVGFTTRRTKLGIEGKVTDDISGKIKFGFSQSSGAAALEDAVLKWKLSDTVTFRAGQFKPALLREENMSSSAQLATDRSSVNETFNQDFTQGIELIITEDDWRVMMSFNDGFGTDNTFYTSATEADYAGTIRGELRLGDASWSQYKQFTSWRGASSGLLLGGAIHYQGMGSSNPSTNPTTEMTTGTIDASLVQDGWNLYAAALWRSMNNGMMTLTDAGYILQGGFFVSDQDEFFGRWDLITPSDSNPTVVGTSGANDFNALTVGWNHYLIPESHAAKFTLELQHYPDPSTESIVSIRGNLLADSTSDQFAITAQFQLLF